MSDQRPAYRVGDRVWYDEPGVHAWPAVVLAVFRTRVDDEPVDPDDDRYNLLLPSYEPRVVREVPPEQLSPRTYKFQVDDATVIQVPS